jgi:cell division protein FtsB
MFSKKSFFSQGLLALLLSGCSQRIDFETDVPQRAKAIANKQADAVRESMEVTQLRQQYRDHVYGASGKNLEQLKKEKKEIEMRISKISSNNSGNICPICRKKYNVISSPKKLVARTLHPIKKQVKGKTDGPLGQTPLPTVQPEQAAAYPPPYVTSPPGVDFAQTLPPNPYAPQIMPGVPQGPIPQMIPHQIPPYGTPVVP